MTVAKIAYEEMTKQERAAAHDILKNHTHYESYLCKNKPNGPSVEEWVFLRAATWPDGVRSHDGWKPEDLKPVDPVVFSRPGDHFTNFAVFAKDATPEFIAKIKAKPAKHDVVCALKQRVAEFELKTISPADKAVALCWLFHLTGDIHQPLHCATLYKEGEFRDGDAGGNGVMIRAGEKKRKVRLHSFWDELLAVTSDPTAEISDTKEYAEEAYKVATLAAARVTKAHPRSALGELKSAREFKDWANESFELAQKVAYADGRIAEIAVPAPKNHMDPLPEKVNDEPEGYSGKAKETAELRGALAGYRLADTIRSMKK
jgi:hypothetical protein